MSITNIETKIENLRVVEAIVKSKPRLLMAKGEESMLPIHLAAAFARKDVLAVLFKACTSSSLSLRTILV